MVSTSEIPKGLANPLGEVSNLVRGYLLLSSALLWLGAGSIMPDLALPCDAVDVSKLRLGVNRASTLVKFESDLLHHIALKDLTLRQLAFDSGNKMKFI